MSMSDYNASNLGSAIGYTDGDDNFIKINTPTIFSKESGNLP